MLLIFIINLFFLFSFDISAKEVNLYTTRHYEADFELYKKFEIKTGIKVNVVSGKPQPLEKRIIEEAEDCVGDLFFLADAGRLYSSEKKKLFQKINSPTLTDKIPDNLRNDYWFGITKRARIIYYNPDTISPDEVKSLNYENLSDSKWYKSIAIRQSSNVYNQSLVASLIFNNGEKETKKWIKGLKKNFFREPSGNDRSQILAVATGEAKLAIANTYYYALMLSGKKGKSQQDAAMKVKPIFPNQKNRGAHINISGIGVLKHSPNKNNAIKLLEYLVSDSAQKHLSKNSFEYPIIDGIKLPNILLDMNDDYIEDIKTPVEIYGKLQKKSFSIMLEEGWN